MNSKIDFQIEYGHLYRMICAARDQAKKIRDAAEADTENARSELEKKALWGISGSASRCMTELGFLRPDRGDLSCWMDDMHNYCDSLKKLRTWAATSSPTAPSKSRQNENT